MNDAIDDLRQCVDDCVDIIVLVQGHTFRGDRFWAYVAVPPGKYSDFREAEAKGHYRLNDWGRILRHGEGREPPAAVRDEMMRLWGARDDFEAGLRALTEGMKAS